MIRVETADKGVTRRVEPNGEMATERKQIVATPRWVARIEEWRRTQPRIPTWSEAVRLLVEAGLDAAHSTESKAMNTHVFKGKGNAYGFTEDATGSNLPTAGAPWKSFKQVDMQPGRELIGVSADDVIAGIKEDGYFVTGVKMTRTVKTAP